MLFRSKSPAFTATTLATLALCLGANLAIFAVVNAILLRPLPFPMADHLVSIFNTYPKAGVPDDGSSVTNYYERRGHIAAFSSLALYRDDAAIVGETGATEREYVMRVTPGRAVVGSFCGSKIGGNLPPSGVNEPRKTRSGIDRKSVV